MKKIGQKIAAIFTIAAVVLYSLAPILTISVNAQEASASATQDQSITSEETASEPSPTPTPDRSSSPESAPSSEPSSSPSLQPSSTPPPEPSPESLPNTESSASPSADTSPSPEPSSNTSPLPELTPGVSTSPSPTSTPSSKEEGTPSAELKPSLTPESVLWTESEGAYITETLRLGVTYAFSPNPKVTLTFTKLPEGSGTITIKEVKLTLEQQQVLGALSDTAYEITSTMQDGTFEYTLTLPTLMAQNVEVKTSEDGEQFTAVDGESISGDVVTITGLNHFTIFVVVGTITSGVATPFDESNASVLINEFVVDPSSGNEWVDFFNRTDEEVDLTGWQVCELTGSGSENCYTLSFTKLLPNGFAVHELTNKLNNPTGNGNGDRISLKNSGGTIIDQVTYQKNSSQIANAQDLGVTNIGDDQSIGRTQDGASTWQVFSSTTTTKGYNNSGNITFLNVGSIYPFTTIQNGIDNVAEDGTVNVVAGEYTETLYIDKSLTLTGASRENTTIFDSDCSGDPTVSIEADDVTVENFTINNDGCGGSVIGVGYDTGNGYTGVTIQDNKLINGYYGVELSGGSSDIQILNNQIFGNGGDGIYSGGGGLSDLTISGNEIGSQNQPNGGSGIYLDQLTGTIVISANTVSYNAYNGVYLGTISGATVTIGGENESDGNTITNNSYEGLSIWSVDNDSTVSILNNTIESNNTAEDSDTGGIYIDFIGQSPGTLTIQDNSISQNNGQGVYVNLVQFSTLNMAGNTIDNNTAQGIYLEQASGSEITIGENNTVSDNDDAGVYLGGVTGVNITGNTIENNGVENGTTGIVVQSASGNEAHENIISGNGEVGVQNNDSENAFDATENFWGSADGPEGLGNNSISGNVLFRPWYLTDALTDLDSTAPTITLSSTASDPTNTTISVTATFNETVTGFDEGDIAVTNGSISNFSSVSGTEYTFDITPETDGSVTVNVVSEAAQDASGNFNTAAEEFAITYDITLPSIPGTPSVLPFSPTNATTQTWSWDASDDLSGIFQYFWEIFNADTNESFSSGTTTETSIVTNLLEGIWNFIVGAQDSAGNQSESASASLTVDTTAPTVTKLGDGSTDFILEAGYTYVYFSEALSNSSKTAVENALTAGADKELTYYWDGNQLLITATEETTFANDVVVNVSDVAGNSAELLLVDSKLSDTQTSPETAEDGSGDATLNNEKPEVVITDPDQEVNIIIDSGTDNPTIDVSSFISGGTGTLPKITIDSEKADITIPASTVVTSADTTWNGVIAAPTVTTVTLPETSGQTKTLSTAIEVGFTGAKLSFDKAVRILLPDQAGKRVGYIRTGIDFTEITSTCSADNQATGDALANDGDCKIDVGSDLVIWTKHFTKFATYTQASTTSSSSTSSSSSSSSSSSGGGSTTPASAPVCNDTKPGSAPTLTGAVASINSVILTWSGAADPVTYYLVTYGNSSGAQTYGNPNIGGKGTTTYTVSGLSGGQTYYFRVRAGNGCTPGDYSNEISATPVGVSLGGPAVGFAPGVLGAATEQKIQAQEGEEVKGEAEGISPASEESRSKPPLGGLLAAIGSFLAAIVAFFGRLLGR